MQTLRDHCLKELRSTREDLLKIPKVSLTWSRIHKWWITASPALLRAEGVCSVMLQYNIQFFTNGYETVNDINVLDDLRARIVSLIDDALTDIDGTIAVRPILDGLILRVTDQKLATLLREFNAAKETQPNLAALGFRTILSLIIHERAKLVDPESPLAKRSDISFDRNIMDAINSQLFPEGEVKRIRRHRSGGDKDEFDNVAHKPGPTNLISKDQLSDAVDLLNKLLPSIVN